MAEPEAEEGTDKKKSGGMLSKLIIWGVVFILGVGTGVAAAMFVLPSQEDDAANKVPMIEKMEIPEPDDKPAFIEFDEVVVNLNDARYSRFVNCKFSIQIANSQKPAIELLLEDHKAVLTNWLIAHLRDKKLEDVRGKLGHNTLRREIHDKFNEVLFTDGIERVQDVLFQDFKVQ